LLLTPVRGRRKPHFFFQPLFEKSSTSPILLSQARCEVWDGLPQKLSLYGPSLPSFRITPPTSDIFPGYVFLSNEIHHIFPLFPPHGRQGRSTSCTLRFPVPLSEVWAAFGSATASRPFLIL